MTNELSLLLDEPRDETFVVVRELTPEDLADLRVPQPKVGPGKGLAPVIKIRHTHHLLARLIADGHKIIDCANATGYSTTRIRQLEKDPAFKELVAHYAAQKEAIYTDVHQRLASVGLMALEEIQERLEEDPAKFTRGELRELVEAMMDRSVAPAKGGPKGPASAPGVQVQINFVEPDRGQLIEARPLDAVERK